MIKIEQGTGTVVRNGETISVFPSMVIYEDEIATLAGDITYSVDELEIITITNTSPVAEEPLAPVDSTK